MKSLNLLLISFVLLIFQFSMGQQHLTSNVPKVGVALKLNFHVIGDNPGKYLAMNARYKKYDMEFSYSETFIQTNAPGNSLRLYDSSSSNSSPYNSIKYFNVLLGYTHPLVPNLDLHLQAGAYKGYYEFLKSYSHENNFLGGTYHYDYEKVNTLGIIISPGLDVKFTRHFGVNIGLQYNYDKYRDYFGFKMGIMLGWL